MRASALIARGLEHKMLFKAIAFALFLIVAATGQARPDYRASGAWYNSLDEQGRIVIQANLVLIGLYDRYIDAEFGPGTYRALVAYQDQIHAPADGVLTDAQRSKLTDSASEIFNKLGFEDVKDSGAQLQLLVPTKILSKRRATERGSRYVSNDGGIVMETVAKSQAEQSFDGLFEHLKTAVRGRKVTYSTFKPETFTLSGIDGSRFFYLRFYNDGTTSSGFSISWSKEYTELANILSIMLANFSAPLRKDESNGRSDGKTPPAEQSPSYGSGTGFFVNSQGLIATNFHVAGTCSDITVPGYGPAKLVKGDEDIDLAVIELEGNRPTKWAPIRRAPASLAEEVVLLGYPLSDLLDSSLNVATGIVSGENGLGGNRHWFTTNAGIQPGNSGGPILDQTGAVIGVAVAKIDDAKMLESMGNTAPNVGFGIKSGALLDFLRIFNFTEATDTTALSVQEIARRGKTFTVQIICRMDEGV